MANRILGGEFTSRINMNLRENKGWSYGAFSINIDAAGPGFFSGYAPVQTDKTKEPIAEMRKEITQFVGEKPATEQEYKKVKGTLYFSYPVYGKRIIQSSISCRTLLNMKKGNLI